MRFCKDFGIFPDIQSRSKLMHLFYSLATLHPMLNHRNQERESMLNEQGRNAELNENHVIDENLFTEALALCATEIEEDTSGHPIEKVPIFYLESHLTQLNRSHTYWKECHKVQVQDLFLSIKPTLGNQLLLYAKSNIILELLPVAISRSLDTSVESTTN